MSKKLLAFFNRIFCSRINERGFTLAEALIITIMTGVCLLPILGTMQNAMVRTENFDHQSKMQQYARSRLTSEIANAAFDHRSINLEDEYHYIVFFAENGEPDEAKKLELVRTSINKDDLKALNNIEVNNNWSEEACSLFGITKANNTNRPYIKIIHAYKTSVEIKDTPNLAVSNTSNESQSEENVVTPKALLGIVVKTSLMESNDEIYSNNGYLLVRQSDDTDSELDKTQLVEDKSTQVVPVSLFSFVNLPTVSDEYIWMVASDSKIIAFDSVSKTTANTVVFEKGEKEPRHIAVHPTGKMLAVLCKNYIYLVNIDIKSPKKNEKKILLQSGTGPGNSYCEGPEEGGGIAFRTDGKVLYFTDKSNKKLCMYEFDYSLAENPDRVLNWNDDTPSLKGSLGGVSFANYSDHFSNIVVSNDGYLYVGSGKYNRANPNDPETKKVRVVYRYPMYNSINDTSSLPIIETENEIRNIDVSNGGRYLLCIPKLEDNGSAIIYDTKTRLSKTIQTDKKITQGIFVTFSGNELDFEDNSLFIALALTGKNANNDSSCIGIYNFLTTSTPWAMLTIDNFNETGSIIESPIDGTMVFTSNLGQGVGNSKKLIFFANYLFKPVNYVLSSDESLEFGTKDTLDLKKAELAAKKRDIIAVAEGEATRTIQLYDLNSLRQMEDDYFIATYTVASLTMNPQGSMILSSHGDYGFDLYHYNILDGSTKKPNIGSHTKKIVFDDSIPDMAFALMYDKDNGGSIVSEYFYNLYNENLGNRWETSSSDYFDRRNYRLDSDWISFDIVGMPNGGALALYGKSDGSSMLEWIGRRNWGDSSNIGKYKLFARWTNIKESSSDSFCTVSNFPLSTCIINGKGDINNNKNWELDNWRGRIEIMTYETLPVNGRVVSINYKYSGWPMVGESGVFEESRYLTPLLLEKQSDESFKIRDYGKTIRFDKDKWSNTVVTTPISWNNNGLVYNSNYRLGFWNGNLSCPDNAYSPSKGAIPYYSDDSNYTFVSDYYTTEKESSGVVTANEIIDPEKIIYPCNLSNKLRNYSLSFNIEMTSHNGFPPLFAAKLAISPDCGTLAILSKKTLSNNKPLLSIFDFNNFNYGPETQIEGMLVDYRARLANRPKVLYPFPKETGYSLFQNVGDKYSLNGNTGNYIASFPSLTTKLGPYWYTFNEYPANYYVSSSNVGNFKPYYNKRFIGYIRPNYWVKELQARYSEDLRLFYNNNYLKGNVYDNYGSVIASAPSINLDAYDTGLLQIDQSNYGDGQSLALFLSNVSSPNAFTKPQADNNNDNGNKFTSTNGHWTPLKSEQTYLLKNQPSFINSYVVKTDAEDPINMNYASMIFSRDKAKPALYIKGQNKLFVLYNNNFKMFYPGEGNNSKDIVISEDGQKLIFGKSDDTLRVYNISNPSDEFFKNGENINGPANNYLGQIATISTGIKPFYLASKPHNSFSSSRVGGSYRLIATGSFKISQNSATVASGGIYIAQYNTNIINVYNPLKNPSSFGTNNLKNNNSYSAVAAYDDNIYLFGNNANQYKVQSFNVITKRAKSTISSSNCMPSSGYDDEYQVSYAIPGQTPTNFGVNDEVGELSPYIIGYDVYNSIHAFINNSGDYASARDNDSYIELNYPCPLTVSSIKIAGKDSSDHDPVRTVKFCGIGGSESTLWNSDWINEDLTEYNLTSTSTPYSKYRIYFQKASENRTFLANISTVNKGGARLIQLWRKDVKRLTPPLKSTDLGVAGTPTSVSVQSMSWIRPDGGLTNMEWSTNNSPSNSLKDIFINNYTDDNNYFSGSSEVWETTASKPWISISLSSPEAVCAVRLAHDTRQDSVTKITQFRLYGSNDIDIPPISSNDLPSNGSGWEAITFTNNNVTFDCPLYNTASRYIEKTFFTAEVKTPTKYRHYLFQTTGKIQASQNTRLLGFEMFAVPAPGPEEPREDYLTPMYDDSLTEFNVFCSAACSTPYGILIAGGKASSVSNASILYWPQAVNKYDGHYNQLGISRSLPNLKTARMNHTVVWHKGKVYAIGGKDSGDGPLSDFIEALDYSSNNIGWAKATTAENASYTFLPNISISDLYRYNHGACSFGDEIFFFGGQTGTNSFLSNAYAWNPESKIVRKLNDIKDEDNNTYSLSPCCAVPFGSKIYVMGMNSNIFMVFEYTP